MLSAHIRHLITIVSCNERLTILINPKVKGPKILQNFKNKETQRGCNWVSLRQKDSHFTQETNIEFDFCLSQACCRNREYRIQLKRSHEFSYCQLLSTQQCGATVNRSGAHNLRMHTSTRCIAPCISNYIESEKKIPLRLYPRCIDFQYIKVTKLKFHISQDDSRNHMLAGFLYMLV